MARYAEAFKRLIDAEYPDGEEDFLHKNSGENGLTVGGVYQSANPESFNWDFIESILNVCDGDIERASIMLYHDSKTKEQVFWFFKKNYWDIARLSEVQEQNTAEEIFLMGVVSHPITAVKLAQKLIRVDSDGICGDYTIKALNNYNVNMFDRQYDNLEEQHFDKVIQRNPHLCINKKGWYNRARLV